MLGMPARKECQVMVLTPGEQMSVRSAASSSEHSDKVINNQWKSKNIDLDTFNLVSEFRPNWIRSLVLYINFEI